MPNMKSKKFSVHIGFVVSEQLARAIDEEVNARIIEGADKGWQPSDYSRSAVVRDAVADFLGEPQQ